MGDLERQEAVNQATNGCLIAVALLGLVAIGSAVVALTSIVTMTLAALLILGGLGLAVMEWAERR